jgi:hypothetical protein
LHDARKFWAAVLIALTLIILMLMVYAPKSQTQQQQVIVNVAAPDPAAYGGGIGGENMLRHHHQPPTIADPGPPPPGAPHLSPWQRVRASPPPTIDLLTPAAASGSGCQQTLRARREHVRVPSLELALIQKELRIMVDVGSPSSGLSLFVATSPGVFVFSFGVETRMSHLLPKRPNWSINPPDPSVIGPGVDFLILQAWDAFMPVVRHALDVGRPRYVIVIPLAPQCTDLRPLLKNYRCTQMNNKFVQCER